MAFLLKKMIAQENTEKKMRMSSTSWTTILASPISLNTFIFPKKKVAYARFKVKLAVITLSQHPGRTEIVTLFTAFTLAQMFPPLGK